MNEQGRAYQEAARQLRNRIVAIRDAAKRPTRGFDLQWQLSSFIDEMEVVFGLTDSANLADVIASHSDPPQTEQEPT